MYSAGIKSLQAGNKDDFNTAATVLIRISSNIINQSDDKKFRSIRIDSKAFQEKILPFDGAVQCLLEMGFQEDADRFTLFMGSNLNDVKAIHDQLIAARKASKPPLSNEIINSQKTILSRMTSHFQHCAVYENKSLQAKAKLRVPIADLNEKARKNLTQTSSSSNKPSFHYCLIIELLAWFKKDFFTWTDAPNCNNCDSTDKPTSIGKLQPTQEDLVWGARRVEGYRCSNCSSTLRFPRYNHPEKLLETRTGRCGEWANCFTLLCRTVGLEARHVLDWTDHVWTEVYIPQWDRWVHCDPCENTCDRPLMYEQGWNKKLSLIVSASAEEIIDVTWRYSVNREPVMERRNAMCDSDWLVQTIAMLNSKYSSARTPERKRELERRLNLEKIELENLDRGTDHEYGGRTSGSLAWRLARGESNKPDERRVQIENFKPIEPTQNELNNRIFHIEYYSKSDEYVRLSNGAERVGGWEKLISKSVDVKRKEELDWKQVYLCRVEGSRLGHLAWKLAIPPAYKVDRVFIKVQSITFESGKASWMICSDTTCDVISPGVEQEFKERYKNAHCISINAFLMGGKGENAWQKSQLFRESTSKSQPLAPSFIFKVVFAKV